MIFFYFSVCVSVFEYAHVHANAYQGRKCCSDALDLDLQMVVNCLLWELGT